MCALLLSSNLALADSSRSIYLRTLKTALDASEKSFSESQDLNNGYEYQLRDDSIIDSQIKQIKNLFKLYKYSESNNISLTKAAKDRAAAAGKNEMQIINAIRV